MLVVAPTQTGKTTGLAIPAVLEWDGPVLATSVKTDLLRDTPEARRARGVGQLFDPGGETALESVSWSPLDGCKDWRSPVGPPTGCRRERRRDARTSPTRTSGTRLRRSSCRRSSSPQHAQGRPWPTS